VRKLLPSARIGKFADVWIRLVWHGAGMAAQQDRLVEADQARGHTAGSNVGIFLWAGIVGPPLFCVVFLVAGVVHPE
jgi:hypothetical protein